LHVGGPLNEVLDSYVYPSYGSEDGNEGFEYEHSKWRLTSMEKNKLET
jgi:hypothetical protein